MKPIKYIKEWESEEEMLEHCRHIVSHAERYVPEKVFEAKQILAFNP